MEKVCVNSLTKTDSDDVYNGSGEDCDNLEMPEDYENEESI